MKRFLLVALAFAVIIYLLRRMAGTAGSPGGSKRRPRGRSAGGATPMVRDRMCNTFLPQDHALRLTRDGETHYFCSAACRDRFTAALPDGSARRVS